MQKVNHNIAGRFRRLASAFPQQHGLLGAWGSQQTRLLLPEGAAATDFPSPPDAATKASRRAGIHLRPTIPPTNEEVLGGTVLSTNLAAAFTRGSSHKFPPAGPWRSRHAGPAATFSTFHPQPT
jgi:hypothetical protein